MSYRPIILKCGIRLPCEKALVVRAGEKYGRLTVVGYPFFLRSSQTVLARCQCGKLTVTRAHRIRAGTSCGCLRADRVSAAKSTRGRQSKTRLYHIWITMIDRCHDPNSDGYRKYGARGIAVCDEWRTDFNAFRDWSLANGYAPHLQIDRRKDAQGYSPGNCRWATASQQAGNRKKRRDGKVSKFKGVSRHNSGRWTAEIMVRGQRRRLGTFGTEKEAALAYDSAAKEGFGEFALTNFGE